MDSDFGKNGLGVVESELKKRGMSLHSKAFYSLDVKDLRDIDQAVKSLSASEPEAVIIIAGNGPAVSFIDQMKTENQKP